MRIGSRSILVVEDSDEDFETVRDALERSRMSHLLLRATTGDRCLRILREGSEGRARPSLVLMDLNTPGVDGRDALVEIKGDPGLRRLPVVVLSTSMNPRDVQFCYEAGANAYHVKPLIYPQHLEILSRVLHYWLEEVVQPQDEESSP